MAGRRTYKMFRVWIGDTEAFPTMEDRVQFEGDYYYASHNRLVCKVDSTWFEYELVAAYTNIRDEEITYVLGAIIKTWTKESSERL